MGIMFDENDVRPMGRTATGVKAITLSDDDYVVSADFADKEDKLLNVTENGYGKRTDAEAFNVQHRGGKGVKIHQITDKTGLLSGVIKVSDNEELMNCYIGGSNNKTERKRNIYFRQSIPGCKTYQS